MGFGAPDSGSAVGPPRTGIPNPESRTPALSLTIASVFGVGYIPFAPGTFGSAAGLLLWWILPASPVAHGAAIVGLFIAGSWASGVTERHLARTDPGQIVIDEVVGILITLFLNPVGWVGACGAFLLFRIADIIKPFPANRLERLSGGIGVMADDAMAAIYANIALRLMLAIARRVIG